MASARWGPFVGLLFLLPLLPSASSAVMLGLNGNVYPSGHFYVTLKIGEQAKPYFLDIDTGSKLTWLECNAGGGSCHTCNKVPHPLYRPTPNKLVPCANSLCDELHQDLGTTKNCRDKPTQCDYDIRYRDKSGSLGVLLTDKFTFHLANNKDVRPDIAFGCGYDQVKKGHQKPVPVDGLLGLGRGSVDLVSQLKNQGYITKNVISHCLSPKGGGFLLIGEPKPFPSQTTWVPMSPKMPGKPNYYSPGQATLQLDANTVDAKPEVVVLDSGSTYTYLPPILYPLLKSALERSLSKSLTMVKDPELEEHVCWKRPGGFKSLDDLKAEFKSVMSLKFGNGATLMIPPENYLIITKSGNACLGMLQLQSDSDSDSDSDMIVIGDISMQDQLVIYDNENGRLGWIRLTCVKKSISAIFSRV